MRNKRTTKRGGANNSPANSMLTWLWEFSKKVVVAVTVVFIIAFMYSMYLIYVAINSAGDATALTTLITEINETFRVVVGGYLIKAAMENVSKIISAKVQETLIKRDLSKVGLEPIDLEEHNEL